MPADRPTVQAGIDAANSGDTVILAPGTYNENIDFKGKAITVSSANGAAATIINGGLQAATVAFQSGETRSSTLSNLTISGGGNGSLNGVENGGIYILHANPTISGNVITGAGCYGIGSVAGAPLIQNNEISHTHVNAATGACGDANGSGIWIDGADNTQVPFPTSQGQTPQVLHNTIEFNTESGTLNGDTIGGAGIKVREGAIPLIEDNIIRNNAINRAAMNGGSGGGILVFAAGATIVNNLIYGNTAVTGGGGVDVSNSGLDSSQVTFLNNTIVDNATQPYNNGAITIGGEQLSFGGSHPLFFEDNIIAGSSTAPMMVCSETPSPQNPSQPLPVLFVTNDLFNGNGPTTGGFNGSSCNYQPGVEGNISANPLFLNGPGSDYHLTLASPAVDTGAASAVAQAAADGVPFSTDLDGNPRIVNATNKPTAIIDLGAYEYQPLPPTNLSLICNPTSFALNGTSVLTAMITAAGTVPTGTLVLTDNGIALAQLPLSSGAAATYLYTGQTAGQHLLSVSYAPTATLNGSSASCTVFVAALPTSATLAVSAPGATFGSPVILTGTVQPLDPPGAGTPTGVITFLSGATPLGTATLANGVASLTISSLPGGMDGLTCTYAGDSIYASSTCKPVPITIAAVPSTLMLSANPYPVLVGAPFSVTVHLADASGAPFPPGEVVQFSSPLGSPALPLNAVGSATLAFTAPLTPGSIIFSATFAGDANLQTSTVGLAEVIVKAASTTSLSVSPSPAYQGQTVTLIAAVTFSAYPPPSGNVSFFDGNFNLGTSTISPAGTATLSTGTLAVGQHSLSANFSGDATFASSVSNAVQETVLPSTFAIVLSPASVTLSAGQSSTVAVTLYSLGAFSGPLTLTTGTLPSYVSAAFTPGIVALAPAGSGSAKLVINTTQQAVSQIPERRDTKPFTLILSAFLVLPLSLVCTRRGLRRLVVLAAIAGGCQALSGCTTIAIPFHPIAGGTYQIPIVATAPNGIQQTATLRLVITP